MRKARVRIHMRRDRCQRTCTCGVLFGWLALTSACGQERDAIVERSGIEVRDSAGIRIVTISASVLESLDVLTADSVAIRVGADESVPDGIIGRVGDAARDAAGGVLVADRMTNRIVQYDSAGHFVRVVARAGNGPGEFRRIERIASRADSVWGYDMSRHVVVAIPLGTGEAREQPSPRARIATMIRYVSRPRSGRVLWVAHEVPSRQGLPDDYYTEILLDDSTMTTVVLVDGQEAHEIGRFAGARAALVSLPAERVDSLEALGEGEVFI